jgi:hypothetical protein
MRCPPKELGRRCRQGLERKGVKGNQGGRSPEVPTPGGSRLLPPPFRSLREDSRSQARAQSREGGGTRRQSAAFANSRSGYRSFTLSTVSYWPLPKDGQGGTCFAEFTPISLAQFV